MRNAVARNARATPLDDAEAAALRRRGPAQLKQSDGDEERKGVYVSDEEEYELPGGSKARRSRLGCTADAPCVATARRR